MTDTTYTNPTTQKFRFQQDLKKLVKLATDSRDFKEIKSTKINNETLKGTDLKNDTSISKIQGSQKTTETNKNSNNAQIRKSENGEIIDPRFRVPGCSNGCGCNCR